MGKAPVRRPVRQRREAEPPTRFYTLWAALAGLLLSPALYLIVGLVFSPAPRSTHQAESDAILAAYHSVGVAVVGAVYWGVIAARLRGRRGASRLWWIAVGIFVLVSALLHVAR